MKHLCATIFAIGLLLVLSSTSSAALTGVDVNLQAGDLPGSYSFDAATGEHTVSGAGHDIWDAADDFHFAYDTTTAKNFVLTAEVVSLEGTGTSTWQKAGVMIRDTLTGGSMHAYNAITSGNGYSLQGRTETDTNINQNLQVTGLTVPLWVRIERIGEQITGFYSSDGVDWTQHGQYSHSAPMGDEVYYGLAVTSHEIGALSTAVFKNLELTVLKDLAWDGLGSGLWDSATQWTGGDPGDVPDANAAVTVVNDTVFVAADAAAKKLDVQSGGVSIVGGQSLTVGGEATFAAGSTLTLDNGATLVAAGGTIPDVNATAGNATINTSADMSVVNFLGNVLPSTAGTFTKAGAGTLSLDNTSGGAVIAPRSTFRVEGGTLSVKGDDPLGGAKKVELAGGTLDVGNTRPGPITTGLLFGTLDGNMNRTDPNPGTWGVDALGTTEAEFNYAPEAYADSPWKYGNTTLIWSGEIYIGASGVASFREDIDDITWLVIDGETLLDDGGWNVPTSGTITRSEGWYPFELRLSNGGGGAGMVTAPGFGYSPTDTAGNTDGGPYVAPQNSDANTADLFRNVGLGGYDLGVDVLVSADSTLKLNSDEAVVMGNLGIAGGTTLTIDADGSGSFADVSAGDGAAVVGNLGVRSALMVGDSPGTLDVIGDLTLAASTVYEFEPGDLINVSGDLTVDDGWTLKIVSDQAASEQLLFTYGGAASVGAATLDVSAAAGWDATLLAVVDDGAGNVSLTVIPEPGTLLLLASGGLVLLALRRRRK